MGTKKRSMASDFLGFNPFQPPNRAEPFCTEFFRNLSGKPEWKDFSLLKTCILVRSVVDLEGVSDGSSAGIWPDQTD
jgi:hypothetical protein